MEQASLGLTRRVFGLLWVYWPEDSFYLKLSKAFSCVAFALASWEAHTSLYYYYYYDSLKQVCHTLLYVYNLPTNRDSKSVCLRLRRLSDNCGGKVLTVSGSGAILRFLSQDSAERAQKRMENEDVFGNRITVSFTPKTRELAETKNSGSSLAEKTKSPKKVNRNAKLCLMSRMANDPSSTTKAVPSKGPQGHGSIPKNTTVKSLQVGCFPVYASFEKKSKPFHPFWSDWLLQGFRCF